MDSKTINKLLRSEIWPLLRQSGFTYFEARNAYAYRGQFINVVNFQSFNSYNAGILACTSFSFSVNIGVYVIGQPGVRLLPRNKAGQLTPHEYDCAFRSVLRKRTPVDGFAREDIFFIDSEGRTTGPCFDELRYLVTQTLPAWFGMRNSIDTLIAGINADAVSVLRPLDCAGLPGSYFWNSVNSLLTLLQHERSPSEETAAFAVNYLDRMIGSILDFSTIQSGRPGEEKNAVDVRELWEHLGAFGPSPECSGSFPDRRGSLTSPAWSAVTESHGTIEDSERSGGETVSARVDLWPMLKRAGFSEFTDRLAHRISDDLVEVVEFLPMDPYERKASNHPPGLFRIGLGLFWNDLREDGLFRRDRVGNPRPIANECHISNWLTPSKHIDQPARTAFDSAQDAGAALSEEGLAWLGLLRDASSAESMLGRANWELFFCFPMMRGYGAKRSPRRLTYLAQFARKLGQIDRAENYLAAAEAVIDTWYVEHFRSKYRSWIAGIRERWAAI